MLTGPPLSVEDTGTRWVLVRPLGDHLYLWDVGRLDRTYFSRVPPGASSHRQGVQWLLSVQQDDGGWGESCSSDVERKYVPSADEYTCANCLGCGRFDPVHDAPTPAIEAGIHRLLQLCEHPGEGGVSHRWRAFGAVLHPLSQLSLCLAIDRSVSLSKEIRREIEKVWGKSQADECIYDTPYPFINLLQHPATFAPNLLGEEIHVWIAEIVGCKDSSGAVIHPYIEPSRSGQPTQFDGRDAHNFSTFV